MSDQEKIDTIIAALQCDDPQTNMGKVLKAMLIQQIPVMPTEKLDVIMQVLGL